MNEPEFLKVRPGDTVLVGEDEIVNVLSFVGGARDPDAQKIFQVASFDTNEIHSVKTFEIKQIVNCRKG